MDSVWCAFKWKYLKFLYRYYFYIHLNIFIGHDLFPRGTLKEKKIYKTSHKICKCTLSNFSSSEIIHLQNFWLCYHKHNRIVITIFNINEKPVLVEKKNNEHPCCLSMNIYGSTHRLYVACSDFHVSQSQLEKHRNDMTRHSWLSPTVLLRDTGLSFYHHPHTGRFVPVKIVSHPIFTLHHNTGAIPRRQFHCLHRD